MLISKRVSHINPSPTLNITDRAKKMKAEGIDVIDFGTGEPDFDTPINIKKAAKTAIDKGFTKYTASSGIKELKDAICQKFKSDNQLEYQPDEIIVSCGAKHSIFNIIFALCDEKNEIILPSPYWVSYPEMIQIVGAKEIVLKTTQRHNFKITPHQLEYAITPKTKLFILNSPSNPTGMVYTKSEMEQISKIIIQSGIYCISDEIYEKIVYDTKHTSIACLGKEIKERTLVVNGLSKAYAMTGWRIGWTAGPKQIIQAMSNLQDHSTSNPVSISQKAAVEALTGYQGDLSKMVMEFKKRRDYIISRINSINGLSAVMPQGAFYCWVNISDILGQKFNGRAIENSLQMADLLLSYAHIAVVPGCVFGDDNYLRFSYATSMENIIEGLNRLEKFIRGIG